jgi:putative SOS response-associated peptidase YedK
MGAALTAEKMMAWKVDRKVGNVKNDTPDLIEPASNVGTI